MLQELAHWYGATLAVDSQKASLILQLLCSGSIVRLVFLTRKSTATFSWPVKHCADVLQMFAREMAAGWTSWGNEVLKFQSADRFVDKGGGHSPDVGDFDAL